MHGVTIRALAASDSIEELTALLHRAYAELAAMGLRYLATHQSADVTAARSAEGECWVAEREDTLVGTITLVPPGRSDGHEWYRRPGVAVFGQFGVEPASQRSGIGSLLLATAAARAVELGATELACDTSEDAPHLVELYRRKGFRRVGIADWRPHTNYRSIVLSKALG